MRGPRCAPLLLLLLLSPLLLIPPAGDAAVITGVSSPGRTCPPGMRARAAPRGSWEGSGSGRVAPGGDICPRCSLALWERCRTPNAADGPGS